ncbi:DgyrCDS7975 [Dimorphilus gyrociliatus]|uniref:Glycerol-3-phosphate dehydrogenase n=1 Tax=Dimorphilus gyrociliatus TaxID=2664684 RepID=A0A7I8VUG1_9ANNE|nr:DgyrCDS7975 [Dimorphilus gyrociliatus]
MLRKLATGSALIATGGGLIYIKKRENVASAAETPYHHQHQVFKSRKDHIHDLKTGEYDVIVVGGGVTGAGVALDAQTRGLKTAILEKDDFSCGTSSRSTKLLHGGVRYLQKAVFNLDYEQYRMVKEALAERANLIKIAPHLAQPLPIMLPVYQWWQLPYFWAGLKMYDLVAGSQRLKNSYFMWKNQAIENFPMLKSDKLVGALVYYDGQHDDARMNLQIVLTAMKYGATILNHASVINLYKGENGKLNGAKIRDEETGEEFVVKAKSFVNAAGPFTDSIRKLDNENIREICQPSLGVHVVLPDYYSPAKMGLLDPATSDGRVIFFLPWHGTTLAGTTDAPCNLTSEPAPTEADIEFILREIKEYLSDDINVRRGDVQAAWAGIRPLVLDPNASSTQSIARNHIIEVSESGLITIAGGKWTTYRHMAEETVDRLVEVHNFSSASSCQTRGLMLDGADHWTPTYFIRLIQDFGLDHEVAVHLSHLYGDKAYKVARMASLTGAKWPVVGLRLHTQYPYIEAEVRYACRREYALSVVDYISRRSRLAFINVQAAREALPKICAIMAEELGWSKQRIKIEHENALKFLKLQMGLGMKERSLRNIPINLSYEEIREMQKRFKSIDTSNKGFITVNDLRRHFHKRGEKISEEQLHEILEEVDCSNNAQIDLSEFLQLMSALRTGAVSQSRFAKVAEIAAEKKPIPVNRSGGGV